jgi:hypothetical protein
MVKSEYFKENGMALKKTIVLTDNFGKEVALDGCYIKIDSLSCTKDSGTITVKIMADSTSVEPYNTQHYSFKPDLVSSDNFIKQAYQELKTRPKFEGAVDV